MFDSVYSVAITGGARGIGRATAAAFAARGARVCIGDLDGDVAAVAAAEIGAQAFALDVTDRASFAAFVDGCGPVDVLVNNAGIMPAGR
ncbi:MAG TPA: SDR family NAD(P)-dependent oxidoreductase, partial [Solirubrobacteraceae bacterium]